MKDIITTIIGFILIFIQFIFYSIIPYAILRIIFIFFKLPLYILHWGIAIYIILGILFVILIKKEG